MSNPNTVKRNNNGLFLSLSLFVLIVAAGTGSAILGYTLGYESIRGINQPEINPTKKITSKQKSGQKAQAAAMVSEKEILAKVDKFIQIQSEPRKKSDSRAKTETKKKTEENKQDDQSFIRTVPSEGTAKVPLSIKTSSQGVSLEIVGIAKQDGDLVIDVDLVNRGNNNVQFLYSFLIIKNEKDSLLSSVTEGLPRDILVGGEKVSGQVKIPLSLLGDSQQLSLTLKDYPDEVIQLEIPKISLEGLSGT